MYQLSKRGYGNINIIRNLDVEDFIKIMQYEQFMDEYERAFHNLNKKN